MAAFTSHQIWDGDNGATLRRLGLPQQSLYLCDASGRWAPLLSDTTSGIEAAALDPTGRRVAYSVFGAESYLHIMDVEGHRIATLEGALAFQWSPDGSRLAALHGSWKQQEWVPTELRLWSPSRGIDRIPGVQPRDIRWRGTDTLYLQYEDRVDALDLRRRRVSRTHHRGADVSPDGRYSIFHGDRHHRASRVYDDRLGLDITGCLARGVGVGADALQPPAPEPFWVRRPETPHSIGVSVRGYTAPPGQRGCSIAVLDARTLERLGAARGAVVVPTPGGRRVILLSHDTLGVVSLRTRPTAYGASEPAPIRVRVHVVGWPADKVMRSTEYTVVPGDCLPGPPYASCDAAFRVARIIDPRAVELEFAAGSFLVLGPGESERAIPVGLRWDPGRMERIVVTPASRRLTTPSVDGGYYVDLSVVLP